VWLAAERARREDRRRLADLGLLASLRSLAAELDPAQQTTLSLRAGLDGPPRLQKDVGRELGGHRLRALKREKKAIARLARERDWLDAVRSRLDAALGGRAHALTTLAADPWWAGLAEVPWVLDYLGRRLLGGHLHVFVLAGELHVAPWPASGLDAPWEDLRRRAEETPVPAPLATFEALAGPVRERLGPGAGDELLGRLRPLLHVEDLGGGPVVTRVCPPNAAIDRRLRRREALVRILRGRGKPATLEDVRAALPPELRASVVRLDLYLERPPFIRCDADRYGLRDRDVPGGAKALASAGERVAAELARRQRGLSCWELVSLVTGLSAHHARWTAPMCSSALRGDARFRCTTRGGVGLSSWESARVLTYAGLLRRCLNEGGGRVPVALVRRRMAERFGDRPGRGPLARLAEKVGAVLRGDVVELPAGARP
jgi:hypothetical protein